MQFERQARALGYTTIAGVDEAGRGPLAGPVVAAACVIPEGIQFFGIKDSKQLSQGRRADLFQKMRETDGFCYSVGIVEADEIDRINILVAALQAMKEAIDKLFPLPDYVLIDGNFLPPTTVKGIAVVGGDTLSQSMAAASIIAKETRDALMRDYHEYWPEYGFDRHKGYGTPRHLSALMAHGPSPIHRRTFAPVSRFG